MATEEITQEEIDGISSRPSVLRKKGPKPRRPEPPVLQDIEESEMFINLPVKDQVRVYDRWKHDVMERLEDPTEKALLDSFVRGRVQETLESRGIRGEAAQSMKQRFLSGKADIVRSIHGTAAQMARIAATDLANVFPGTNEKETTIARANQRWIREIDEQLDDLRGELKSEFDKPGKGNNRAPEIIKSMRALEKKKKPLEAVLKPILEKTKEEGKAAGFVTAFAGNQELAAQKATIALQRIQNRFRKSAKFPEEHPYIDAVASGAGDLPLMIAQSMLRAPGMVTLAMQMGQRAEDEAREIHPELTDEEAFAIRSVSGATQAGLERMGIDVALQRLFGGAAGLTGGQIASRIATKRGALKSAAISGGVEAGTEPVQSILNGEIIQAVTGEEVDTLFTWEAFKDRTVDAFAGFFLGAPLGAIGDGSIGKAIRKLADPSNKKAGKAIPEDRTPMADPEGPQTAPLLTPEEAANPAGVSTPEAPATSLPPDPGPGPIAAPPAETALPQTSEEADVPDGTNEQPVSPTEPDIAPGPPLEPRQVFRQVRKAVAGVPNASATTTQRKSGSGVTFTASGHVQFNLTPSDIQGKGDDSRFVMDEELTHLAEVLGARDEWEASGEELPFTAFLDKRAREHVAAIDEDLLDLRSADRQVAARSLVESIRAYTRAGEDQKVDFDSLEKAAQTGSIADVLAAARESGVIGSDGAIFSEWLRQIDQIERTGTTTELAGEADAGVFARLKESIREALRKAIEWIDRGRSVLRKSQTFTGDIEAITRKRQELSLPALSRPQTTQQAPPAAEIPRTPPDVVEQQGTEGMPAEEAARVHRTSDPPPTPPLRPTPEPGEGFVTGPQNKNVDLEREALGLEHRDPIMRTTFGEMWDRAKEINFDGQAGSQLVNELLENPRALNPEEVAILGHEQVRRRHELDKAMFEVNDPLKSETQREFAFNRFREAQVAMNRIADAIQNMGTLQGQALNLRKMLIDDQFDLVTLKRARQTQVNGGEPLTKAQHEEIEGFFNRVQKLRNELDKANERVKNAKNKNARDAAESKAKDIEFELAKEITKQAARDNKAIFKRLNAGDKAIAMATEFMHLPRALMTTFDFSATLRQGGLVVVSHPIMATKAFNAQMKAFLSERGEFEVMQAIRNDPMHAAMVADGSILHIGETTLQTELDINQKKRDEAYQSVLANRMPIVKSFGRAYQTFLNQLRFDLYKLLVNNLAAGTKEQRNAIARMVNIMTGRGGGNMGDTVEMFAATLFSPRYQASRIQYIMTLPMIWRQPEGTRAIIAKEIARQMIGVSTVIGMFLLAKEAFDEDDEWGVEFDRRSSDFLKLRVGNTRHDIMSGLSQYIVMEERVRTGRIKSLSSGEVTKQSPARTIGNFARSKLAPVTGTTLNVFDGENVIGQPAGLLDFRDIPVITNLTGAKAPAPFVDLFMPLTFNEVEGAIEEHGFVKGSASGIISLLGWAGGTYEPGEGFGVTEGGLGDLVEEYGYGGLIKELYTRSTEEGKLLLRAFEDDKPMMYFRDEPAPRLTPEEAANPRGR